MRDFTLVIPTYNRPKQLASLLAYLGAQQAQCRVLILDSSQPKHRQANRKIVALANFNLKYAEFPSEMHPFDKFREGVHKVTTEFFALCADDDLIVLDGVQRCLEALRSNPKRLGRPGLFLLVPLPPRRGHGSRKHSLFHRDDRRRDAAGTARQALRPLPGRHLRQLPHAGAAAHLRHAQADEEHSRARTARKRAGGDRRAHDPGAMLQPWPQHGRLRKLRALASVGVVCKGLEVCSPNTTITAS